MFVVKPVGFPNATEEALHVPLDGTKAPYHTPAKFGMRFRPRKRNLMTDVRAPSISGSRPLRPSENISLFGLSVHDPLISAARSIFAA